MRFGRHISRVTALWLSALPAVCFAAEAGWQPLLDGEDLAGWVNVNTAPETWQVRDGAIVCDGRPCGFLRTTRTFEDYVLEFEWRGAGNGDDVGILVHADALPQVGTPYPKAVEVRAGDGDRGTISGIGGCTIRPVANAKTGDRRPDAPPSEARALPAEGWNHCRLTSRHGTLELVANGRVVARAADATQVRGYVALKSEGAEVHFRNVRIRELPGARPPAEKVAAEAEGFASIFDGLTFRGWKHHEGLAGRWEIDDGVFRLLADQPPRKRGQDVNLWHEESLGDFVLIADWRLTGTPERRPMNDFTKDGLIKRDAKGRRVTHEILHAGDSGLYLRGDARAQVNIWSQPMGSGDINSYHKDAKLPVEIRRACVPKTNADRPPGQWNRFRITMQGDRVTVVLNGRTVIEHAQLPGVPQRGPIALQNHRDPIEFRNLFLKRLPE